MIPTIARIVQAALTPRQNARKPVSVKDLATIRQALLSSIEDCISLPAQRLRLKIDNAKTPQELWMLRNDAYQLISQRHNQSIAAERINALIRAFEGSLARKQLVKIR